VTSRLIRHVLGSSKASATDCNEHAASAWKSVAAVVVRLKAVYKTDVLNPISGVDSSWYGDAATRLSMSSVT